MAGGLGTRLRPLTYAIPKPLLPIGDRPILEILLRQLVRAGFGRAFISTGYKGELISPISATAAGWGSRSATWKSRSRSGPPARSRSCVRTWPAPHF